MKPLHILRILLPALAGLGLLAGTAYAAGEEDLNWNTHIKPQFYAQRPIQEGNEVIELTAPYRAEDPALVPIQIASKIPQAKDHYIKNITLFIDNNPTPFSASFDFTPDSGKADVAMRVRVNAYSNVRAVAETNDGKLYLSKAFVKASGGCSAPIGADLEAAMARMGKMKFKLDGGKLALGQPSPVQLLISHPNISGLQMDQISRLIKPAHFVDVVKVSFDGQPVMTAKTDIAISADPNFRFYFVPSKPGELKAEIKDNLGNQFSQAQAVAP
jgi:sulfur-oxidizing protein SoxY